MFLRVVVLLAFGLVVSEAKFRSTRAPPISEDVNSECFQRAQPFMASIQDTLHTRRQKIRAGCRNEAYMMHSELRLAEKNHSDSLAICDSEPYSETCRYLLRHGPYGKTEQRLMVNVGRMLHMTCSSTLSGVVEDLADEAVQLMKMLSTCAPQHACYIYQMARDYMHHVGAHIRDQFHVSGRVRDICARINLDLRMQRACERYNVALNTLHLAKDKVYELFTHAGHDSICASTSVAAVSTEAANSNANATRDSTLPPTSQRPHFIDEEGKMFVVDYFGTPETPSTLPKDKPVTAVLRKEQPKKPSSPHASHTKFRSWKRLGAIGVSVFGAVIVLTLLAVILARARKHRSFVIQPRPHHSEEKSTKTRSGGKYGPLASEDTKDVEDLKKIAQVGFVNPAYTFYEDLPEEV